MAWIEKITVHDGLEETGTARIVSYIANDNYVQLSGFFTTMEIDSLASYLKSNAPRHLNGQHPQILLPD